LGGQATDAVDFTIDIPADSNGIEVAFPIADSQGIYTVTFTSTSVITFWQVDSK
jgi:hypothetical protein